MKRDRRKRKKKGGNRAVLVFLILFVLVVCGVMAYKRVSLEQDAVKAYADYEAAKQVYEEEAAREQELDQLRIYTQTKKFVEDMAREKFGLVYENEIIFQPEE